eukprot:364577-Chlamydomonas_euryale.AAC.23
MAGPRQHAGRCKLMAHAFDVRARAAFRQGHALHRPAVGRREAPLTPRRLCGIDLLAAAASAPCRVRPGSEASDCGVGVRRVSAPREHNTGREHGT